MADDVYFTVDEIRERFPDPLEDDTKYPDELIEAQRAMVEERLERLCDVAFVPREATETLNGDGSSYLEVRHTRPIEITEAADTGTDIDLTDAALSIGTFYLPAGWNVGVANLTVTYTHGYPEPPLAVKEAAMLWTRELVVEGPVTSRATQLSTDDGGVINLATPGLFGSTTGYPAIDEVIAEYRYPSFVG